MPLYKAQFKAECIVEAKNKEEARRFAWHDIITDMDRLELATLMEVVNEGVDPNV